MKHLNASFSDLHRIFKDSISAREIAEPMVSFESDRSASQIRLLMEERDFDVVGVRSDGEMRGYVIKEGLDEGTLADHMLPFREEMLLNENEPLLNALEALKNSGWAFIRFLNCPVGIVTRGDLQKAPVRMWLFGIISLLEMRLLMRMREAYPDGGWKSYLSYKRLGAADSVYAVRKRLNEAIDLAECLQLCDKKTIYGKSDRLGKFCPFESKGKWDNFMSKVEELRNALAHSNSIAFSSWPDVTQLVEDMEKCLNLLESGELTRRSDENLLENDESRDSRPSGLAIMAKEIYLENELTRKGVASGEVPESTAERPLTYTLRDRNDVVVGVWFEHPNGHGKILELYTKSFYGAQSDKHKVVFFDSPTGKYSVLLDFQLGQASVRRISETEVPEDILALYDELSDREQGD